MSRSIFPYLENLHSFRYSVPTFVEHNPFGRSRCIDWNNLGLFKMLFVKWSRTCKPTFYNSMKLKLKQKVPYWLFILKLCFFEYLKTFISIKFVKNIQFYLFECCLYSLSLKHLVLPWWALGWTSHSHHHLVSAKSFRTSTCIRRKKLVFYKAL